VLGTSLQNGALVAVSPSYTMRQFERLCPPRVEPLQPAQIKRIRVRSHVSEVIFAALLNTSVSTVQKWEIGQKRPTGTALKLLQLVQWPATQRRCICP
jgi:putative transcriptional regulator